MFQHRVSVKRQVLVDCNCVFNLLGLFLGDSDGQNAVFVFCLDLLFVDVAHIVTARATYGAYLVSLSACFLAEIVM